MKSVDVDEIPSPKKKSNPKKESVDENSKPISGTNNLSSTDPPKLTRKLSSGGVPSPKKRQKKEEIIQTRTILSYFKPLQKT